MEGPYGSSETAQHTADVRLRRRQTEAIPILDRLETLIIAWEADQRPSSGLFGAAQYTRKIFQNLRTYTTDGRIPIDNNDLERLCAAAHRADGLCRHAAQGNGGAVDWQDGVSIMGCLDAYTPAICIDDEVTAADHAVTHARKGGTSSLRALHEIFHFDMSES
jgi:hypothetical protein